jgi:LssY C-terminus
MRYFTPILVLLFAAWLAAQSPPETSEFDIAGNQSWLDTGLDLGAGDALRISATGTLQFPSSNANGPEGLPRGWRDLVRALPMNDAGRGALLARIGDRDTSPVFPIGALKDTRAAPAGRLFLGVNRQGSDPAQGSYHVAVAITRGAPPAANAPQTTIALPRLTQAMLDQIPARIGDAAGNPGDRVNFLILGSEQAVEKVFQTAGWVKVDRSVGDAVLHGLLLSLSKQAYLTLPMSVLYLFGRPQDYGYAHAEPVSVVASRNHLRLWKAPFQVEGQTLWAGAATHDIGFERDQRNGGVTHKIDPEVDGEREYVAQSLNDTGLVARVDYMTAANPVIKEAKTATGGGFRSDGRTLILSLPPEGKQYTTAFADLFAAVLRGENPDSGEWGDASRYLETPSTNALELAPLSNRYRVLIVPGFMNACASSAPAFEEGQDHLRGKHGMDVELLAVPNDSSEGNARRIAEYLKGKMAADQRKYIVVGYSKGAPDVQVALAQEPGLASSVAAFVSVAGAVGGSPVVDALPAQFERWTSLLQLGKCEGDLNAALRSLRRDVRQAFLSSHPDPPVPAYSIVATSDRANTSKALLEAWRLLSVYDPKQDSQLTEADATLPGSKFLGAAKADHLAIALPFEKSREVSILNVIDHGHFPRAALLEALVRFVVQDLDGK